MLIAQEQPNSQYQIRSCGSDFIQVNNEQIKTSFIISPTRLDTSWQPTDITELTHQHWTPILALEPEVILLGTGNTIRFPESSLLKPIHNAGIGLEIMDNRGGCHTYQVLISEGRRVAAAFMLT